MINYTPPTQHTSLFYHNEEEYFEIIVPYIKAGLENNEFCFWNIPPTVKVETAKEHLARAVDNSGDYLNKGQLEILDYQAFYFQNGLFSPAKTLERYAALEAKILADGFKWVRAVGDGSWASGSDDWLKIMMYEEEINQIINLRKMRAICTYYVNNLDLKDICSIGCSHQSSLVKQMGNWSRLSPDKFKQASTY